MRKPTIITTIDTDKTNKEESPVIATAKLRSFIAGGVLRKQQTNKINEIIEEISPMSI